MAGWIEVALFFTSWFLLVVAEACRYDYEDTKNHVSDDRRHQTLLFPVFPVFPIISWVAWANVGTWTGSVIVWLHILLLLTLLAYSAHYRVLEGRLRAQREAQEQAQREARRQETLRRLGQ